MRCVRGLKDANGKSMFAVKHRGIHSEIVMDHEVCANITDEMAQKAMDICPVGVILRKEVGSVSRLAPASMINSRLDMNLK
jgi:NADH dehydrogenase/NADH:ubiquinone oxidoreductase subunit G